jgi:hypothetical protein
MKTELKWAIGATLAIAYQATIGGGFGNLQAQVQQGQSTRQQRQADSAETQARQIAADKLLQQAPIADARYKAGCQIVVSSANSTNSMAIVVGAPVWIGGSNVPLSAGNLVCDPDGFTAQIIPGVYNGKPTPVAGLEARTMDQGVIDAAVARYQKQGVNIKQNSQ